MITINFNKAKDITKDKLRKERQPLLEALDVEMMRNWTNQEKIAEIDAKKQILRDAPALVDSLTTIEELKAVTLPVI